MIRVSCAAEVSVRDAWKPIVLLGMALLIGSGAHRVACGDGPAPAAPSLPSTVDAVRAAVAAKDTAALGALAARTSPDPWMVADELWGRGDPDAARQFAAVTPESVRTGLVGYLTGLPAMPDDGATRQALDAANEAFAKKDWQRGLDALSAVVPTPDRVSAVRSASGRATALRSLGRALDAGVAFEAAGSQAARLGWYARASSLLYASAEAAFGVGDYVPAISRWKLAIAAAEAGGRQEMAQTCRANLAVTLQGAGQPAEAIPLLEGLVEAYRASKDLPRLGFALESLGGCLDAIGRRVDGLKVYEEALALAETEGDPATIARRTFGLGTMLLDQERPADALPRLERSLGLYDTLGDKPRAAETLRSIGMARGAIADFPGAIAAYQKAIEAFKTLGDRAGWARTLANLGNVHFERGEHRQALALEEEALAMQEGLPDRVMLAATLGNVADVRRALGEHAAALAAQERALSILETEHEPRLTANVHANLGVIHHALGDDERALASYERAVEMYRKLGALARVAVVLGNAGNILLARGDLEGARARYELAWSSAVAVKDRVSEAHMTHNLALLDRREGRLDEARAGLTRALALREAIGDREGMAADLASRASVEIEQKDFVAAVASATRAVTVADEIGVTDLQVRARSGLAWARWRTKDAAGALGAAQEAIARLPTLVGGLSDEQGAVARGQYTDLFQVGWQAAQRLGDVEAAAAMLESGRAGSLREWLRGREALVGARVPDGLREGLEAARAREGEAVAALQRVPEGAPGDVKAAARSVRDAARDQVRDAVGRIQREAKGAAAVVYPDPASLAELRATLGAGDVLVLYALAPPTAAALVVDAEQARIVDLGTSADALEAARALTERLREPGAPVDADVARAKQALVEPLALDPRFRRVLVSPEGTLAYLPFALLFDDREVTHVPSGTTYAMLRRDVDLHGERTLALGDPGPDAPGGAASTAPLRSAGVVLPRLPAAAVEARAVGDEVLIGAQATIEALRAALPKQSRWRSVHLACHALVDVERPDRSRLVLAPSARGDGDLTVLDVFQLAVPTDLAVLSACETGRGQVAQSEGIVGWTRAFMCAGAPRVLCSLWKVDDEATRLLMTRFYALWSPKDGAKPIGAAAALRAAQAAVREHEVEVRDAEASQAAGKEIRKRVRPYAHPAFWAAWVLWGLPE